MTTTAPLILTVLRRPASVRELGPTEWDFVIRQGRQGNLLARLHHALAREDLLDRVPERPRFHLEAAWVMARRHAEMVRWEASEIARILRPSGCPVILLKGAAYTVTDLPPARGRLFTDIDIMVPKPAIGAVEQRLRRSGWLPMKLDPYDQRYYRTWMHELPPLRHVSRGTTLDVHHTILPESGRFHPDADRLRESAMALDTDPQLYVLAPEDMILHSVAHLFSEGEFEHALRDLLDIDDLLRHFTGDDAFWQRLVTRAEELDLARLLLYALRSRERMLAVQSPSWVDPALLASSRTRPALAALMDRLFAAALRPHHVTCRVPLQGLALWLLYVRGHYLRMPAHLLLPHLLRKWLRRSGAATPAPGKAHQAPVKDAG